MKLGIDVHSLEKQVAEKNCPAGHFLEQAEAQRQGEQSAVVTNVFYLRKVGEQQREEHRNCTRGAQRVIFPHVPNNHGQKSSKDGRQ